MVSWGQRRTGLTVKMLTAACVGLAVICLLLTSALNRVRNQAQCWRNVAIGLAWPIDGSCAS